MTAVQHSDVVINTVGSQQGVGLNTLAEGFHICVVSPLPPMMQRFAWVTITTVLRQTTPVRQEVLQYPT